MFHLLGFSSGYVEHTNDVDKTILLIKFKLLSSASSQSVHS